MDPGRPPTTAVCTLGMHRSGTSVVTRLLNLLGVYLGDQEAMLAPLEENPRGFWEHHSIHNINEAILEHFGGGWDDPPIFPPGWAHDERLADLRDRARQVVTELAAEPLWGWKDPRTCLTLPFWQALVGPTRYVIVVRSPDAVVASLERRNGLSRDSAERLWLAHVQAGLTQTSGQPRLFVLYDAVLDDWLTELRRLSAFIGRPERAEDPAVQEAVSAFLADDLRHHRSSDVELTGDRRMSLPSISVYLAMREHARRDSRVDASPPPHGSVPSAHDGLARLATRALEAWDDQRALAAGRDHLSSEVRALSTERDQMTARLRSLEDHAAALVAERDRLAIEQQALQETTQDLIAGRDQLLARDAAARRSLAAAESALAHAVGEHARQEQAAQDARRTLREIQGSSAWRIVAASRTVLVRLLPAGTYRRRIFDAVLNRIVRRLPAPSSQSSPLDLRAA